MESIQQNTVNNNEIIDEQELADRLKISRRSVRDMVKRREIPFVMITPQRRRFIWSQIVEHYSNQQKAI